eukprot:gene8021-13931_t
MGKFEQLIIFSPEDSARTFYVEVSSEVSFVYVEVSFVSSEEDIESFSRSAGDLVLENSTVASSSDCSDMKDSPNSSDNELGEESGSVKKQHGAKGKGWQLTTEQRTIKLYKYKGPGSNFGGEINGKTTVPHILSGKAEPRALRGHFLIESALVCKLMTPLIASGQENGDSCEEMDRPTFEEATVKIEDLCSDLEKLKNEFREKHHCDINMQRCPTLSKLTFNLEEYKKDLAKTFRTSKLWLQYLDYIAVVKMFIRAERIGDWNLHLVSLNKMLNLFAATAHVNYAKCARLHLHDMLDLESSHPWVYDQFARGNLHTVRRSERFWSGL